MRQLFKLLAHSCTAALIAYPLSKAQEKPTPLIDALYEEVDDATLLAQLRQGAPWQPSLNAFKDEECSFGESCFVDLVLSFDRVEILRYLLEHGLSLDTRCQVNETTLLSTALSHGAKKCALLLAQKGAKVGGSPCHRHSAIDSAIQLGHLELLKFYLEKEKGADRKQLLTNLLLKALFDSNSEPVIATLVEEGANIHHTDSQGRNCLELAARNHSLAVFQYLLSQGLELKQGGKIKPSLLHLAAKAGNRPLFDYLMAQGADPHLIWEEAESIWNEEPERRSLLQSTLESYEPEFIKHVLSIKDITRHEFSAKENSTLTPAILSNASNEIIRLLVEMGAKVNDKTSMGESLLHLIVSKRGVKDQPQLIDYLVSKGAHLQAKDKLGNTLLHAAIKSGDIALVRYLVKKGLSPSSLNNEGSSPYLQVLSLGNKEIYHYFKSLGTKLEATQDALNLALIAASSRGKQDSIALLLEAGAQINAVNKEGQTALSAAKDFATVEYLLARGAVETEPARFAEMLFTSIHSDDKKLVNYVLQKKLPQKVLNAAFLQSVYLNNISLAKRLLKMGASPSYMDGEGNTCLHAAAYLHDTKALEFLLGLGLDINARTIHQRTPLHISVESSWSTPCTKLLLEHGAQVNLTDTQGNTALHFPPNAMSIKLLLDAGANIEARNNEGLTPFLSACIYPDVAILKLLIARGANIHAKDKQGKGALELLNPDAESREAVHYVQSLYKSSAK